MGSIEPRRALLQAATGEARLEMAYATNQSILATEVGGESGYATPQATAATALSQTNGEPEQKAELAKSPARMSFQDIYGVAPKQDPSLGQVGNE